jgi:hypothetical protein
LISIFSRASTSKSQRGFVLISALVLSLLYFALMELLLIDSSRALNEAQRFRARIVATALAESGAELAANQIVTRMTASVNDSDYQGTMSGSSKRVGNNFEIQGDGTSIGVPNQDASVQLQGRIDPDGSIKIDFAVHSQ